MGLNFIPMVSMIISAFFVILNQLDFWVFTCGIVFPSLIFLILVSTIPERQNDSVIDRRTD